MKKIILLLLMIISCGIAQAATYLVNYDVNNQRKTSFIVVVNSDRITIGQNVYSLRQLGTITNSGLVLNSYMFGQNKNMFCVSTTPITIEKDQFTRLKGYVILIDDKGYLAEKIN